MNFKKILAITLCLVLIFGCVMPLASCGKKDKDNGGGGNTNTPGGNVVGGGGNTNTPGGNNNATEPTPDGKTNYTIQVKTVGGMPLKGVSVYVHKGNAAYNLVAFPKATDENGMVTYELDTASDYSIQLVGVPQGYNVKSGSSRADRYDMGTTGALIQLASAPVTTGTIKDSYKLGDVMYDFTVTDIDGNSYKLSEMLKTKRAVVLNFWYFECGYCAQEFPSLNSVYQRYSDKLEILALNDYGDDISMLRSYPEHIGVDLKMPLFSIENKPGNLVKSAFSNVGYPTTVIIDRYGVITMIDAGAIIGENKWERIFQHFTADNYEQKLITDSSVLTPIIEPTVKWDENSESEIAGAFNKGDIDVKYYPELKEPDAKYSWPFVATTFNGINCVKPSNSFQDSSYSILYADVSLKPGQAVAFDYYSSTQKGEDALFVLVDGKDIYSISGDSVQDGWSTCISFVDPRLVDESNKDTERTYQIAFAYYKDDYENYGDDTVYLKDLRVISTDEIETETYIFRYAATDENDIGGYNTYVKIYLGEDGFYHVGNPDGPFLLANLLSYSLFDPYMTVSQRVYVNYELMVGDVNMFNQWVTYGNAASNSQITYYTAVTPDLAEMLKAYCKTYAAELAKDPEDENLWLQLCAYYDEYGKDENGNPAKLENPIKGLTDFSAFEVEINEDAVYESENIIASGEITYNRGIMPRGYLYKFVPTVSGVYRITSKSDGPEINGWIFIGNSKDWAEYGRQILTSYEVGERFNRDLLIDPDGDGVSEIDYTNTSMVAYMEAGTPYYIDLAYYDVAQTGTFTFDIKWLGESYTHYFIQASPGPITYIESMDGGMGELIAGGIDHIFANALVCTNCGELVGYTDNSKAVCPSCKTEVNVNEATKKADKYAFHLIGYEDAEKTVPIIGSVIYADFFMPTTLFPSQSIEKLIIANAFNFTITETDREALEIIDNLRLNGKKVFIDAIVTPELEGAEEKARSDAEAKWTEIGMDAAIEDKKSDGRYDAEYSEQMKIYIEFAIEYGKEELINIFTDEFYKAAEDAANKKAEAAWKELSMDDVIRYGLAHATVKVTEYTLKPNFDGGDFTGNQIDWGTLVITSGVDAFKNAWGDDFATKWNELGMNEVISYGMRTAKITSSDNEDGTKSYTISLGFDGTNYTDEQKTAATAIINLGAAALKEVWDKNYSNKSFDEMWLGYEMNTVISFGFYHTLSYAGGETVYNAEIVEADYSIILDYSGTSFTDAQTKLADETIKKGLAVLKSEWGVDFISNWANYQITEIINECTNVTHPNYGIFHNTDKRTDKDKKAQEYLKYLAENGKEALKAYWDAEFPSIIPEGEGDISELRYEYMWDYYKMDDVEAGIFHGKVGNYSEIIEKYRAEMDNSTVHYERQGCVAVTEELAEILNILVDMHVFEDVRDAWLKFCYYYNILGA